MKEIFNLLQNIPKDSKDEIFEEFIKNDKIRIERIISYGQKSSEDFWYEQDEDEFVLVLEGDAKIKYENGEIYELKKASSLYIKAYTKHQVIYTSKPCIWLAIFIKP